ncbi:hypothetical protein ACN9MN_03595 [Chryseobacterium sp. S-02]|uniref:hypothetical protein n=1 Tax=Chryseobacterium sp. S-02 TaxID=3404064 RepID=UPI003CF8F5B0
MNNRKTIEIILMNRVIIFLLLLVIIPNLLTILTYIYIAKTVYPGIVFLVSILLIYLSCRSSLYKKIDFYYVEDILYINDINYFLSDLQSYSFKETNYVGTIVLKFSKKKVKLYLRINRNLEYQKLKDCIVKLINRYNKQNNNRIKELNWYNTKSAKIYGYIIVCVMILWILLMLVYPEKLKLSNLGIFFVALVGLLPILFKIFRNNKPV